MNDIVTDFDIEFFFAEKNEVSKFKRVDAEVADKFGFVGDIFCLDGKLFYEKFLDLFVHDV